MRIMESDGRQEYIYKKMTFGDTWKIFFEYLVGHFLCIEKIDDQKRQKISEIEEAEYLEG